MFYFVETLTTYSKLWIFTRSASANGMLRFSFLTCSFRRLPVCCQSSSDKSYPMLEDTKHVWTGHVSTVFLRNYCPNYQRAWVFYKQLIDNEGELSNWFSVIKQLFGRKYNFIEAKTKRGKTRVFRHGFDLKITIIQLVVQPVRIQDSK